MAVMESLKARVEGATGQSEMLPSSVVLDPEWRDARRKEYTPIERCIIVRDVFPRLRMFAIHIFRELFLACMQIIAIVILIT